jgi:hypothetical protein
MTVELFGNTFLNSWSSTWRTFIFLKFVDAGLAENIVTLIAACRITNNHSADRALKNRV